MASGCVIIRMAQRLKGIHEPHIGDETMQYTVVLTEEENGTFSAAAPSLPNCYVNGETMDEAPSSISQTIAEMVGRCETIQVDVSADIKSGRRHRETPWDFFGAFKDDPTWGALFDPCRF